MDIFTLLEDDSMYDRIIKENLQERKIILNDEIDDSVIENICLMILKWNKEDENIDPEKRKHILFILIRLGVTLLQAAKY